MKKIVTNMKDLKKKLFISDKIKLKSSIKLIYFWGKFTWLLLIGNLIFVKVIVCCFLLFFAEVITC